MTIQNFLQIYIIVILIINCYDCSVSNAQYEALLAIRDSFQLQTLYPADSQGLINFEITTTAITYDVQHNSFIRFNLTGNGTNIIPNVWDKFFTNTTSYYYLYINNAIVINETEFFTSLYRYRSITCNYCNITNINFEFTTLDLLRLQNNPLSGTFKIPYSLDTLDFLVESQNYNIAQGLIFDFSQSLKLVRFTSAVLEFNNISQLEYLKYAYIQTLSNTNFQSIYTLSNRPVTAPLELTIQNIDGSTNLEFPMNLLEDEEFKITILRFKNCNFKPITRKIQMNVNNIINSLYFVDSSNFYLNGNGDFPFENLSNNLQYLTLSYLGIKLISNSNIFSKVIVLDISNNEISQPLIISNFTENCVLNFQNNSFSGIIDSATYCNCDAQLNDNLLTGSLPNCILCSLKNPSIRLSISGNNFNNYQDGDAVPQCPGLVTNADQLLTGYASLKIYGENLGYFSSDNMVPSQKAYIVDPLVKFSVNIINKKISASLTPSQSQTILNRGNVTVVFPIQNITVTLPITREKPNIIDRFFADYSSLGFVLNLVGYGLSSDYNNIKITVGEYNCLVTENDDNTIACVIYNPKLPEKVYRVNANISGYIFEYDIRLVRGWPLLTSYISSPRSGGAAQLFGVFGNGSTIENSNITLYDTNCPIGFINNTYIQFTAPPGSGRAMMNLTVQGKSLVANYYYLEDNRPCPSNCNGNGICQSDGFSNNCYCMPGWIGSDCSIVGDQSPVKINNTNGQTEISNEDIQFGIRLISLQELHFNGNIEREIPFQTWSLQDNQNSSNIVQYQLKHEDSVITYTIEQVLQDRNQTFAGVDIHLKKDTIKLTVNISNWQFYQSLNTLRLIMHSYVQSKSDCEATINRQGQTNESIDYFTIQKDGNIFYGKFIDRVLSDGRSAYSSTIFLGSNDTTIRYGITLPHFTREVLLDPDFSVLVDGLFDGCDNSSNAVRKWLIPTVVLVSIFGVLSIILVIIFFVRKYFYVKLTKHGIIFLKHSKIENSTMFTEK
ncbi:tenascin C [Tieghemostelium lacteum]|uniref:Tenascin C n=1 Tax=Tieghemostelium lacteum TaxID=361077 RepID=A0A151ZGP5_TIELA|nr:tenascin C [Tieghemostelium lacteum]|eukprot:KYQ93079.1 tenascin C [Tieghemostelium lacteum]